MSSTYQYLYTGIFCLYLLVLGLRRNCLLQQGQYRPSHFIKMEQISQYLYPASYILALRLVTPLYCLQVLLHAIFNNYDPLLSERVSEDMASHEHYEFLQF